MTGESQREVERLARQTALVIAASGAQRDEAARYLAQNFDIDHETVLDETYAVLDELRQLPERRPGSVEPPRRASARDRPERAPAVAASPAARAPPGARRRPARVRAGDAGRHRGALRELPRRRGSRARRTRRSRSPSGWTRATCGMSRLAARGRLSRTGLRVDRRRVQHFVGAVEVGDQVEQRIHQQGQLSDPGTLVRRPGRSRCRALTRTPPRRRSVAAPDRHSRARARCPLRRGTRPGGRSAPAARSSSASCASIAPARKRRVRCQLSASARAARRSARR